MDNIGADLAIQAILGRGGDFIGGIDNEALDFSQLEAFINSEGTSGSTYFSESLSVTPAHASTGKLLNVIVENKRPQGHALPESPPDSSSEHPYSPQDSCDQPLNSEIIYTTLGQQNLYKEPLNPIISENLILSSPLVVQNTSIREGLEGQIIENSILRTDNLRNTSLENQIIRSESLMENGTLRPLDNLRTGSLENQIIRSESLMESGTLRPLENQIIHPENGTQILPSEALNGNMRDNIPNISLEGRLIVQDGDHRMINGRILMNGELERGIINGELDGRHMIITQESDGQRILIQPGPSSQGSSNFTPERTLLVETSETRQEPNINAYNPNIDISRNAIDNQIIDNNIDVIYTNLQSAPKKRKLSQDVPLVKSEPELCPPGQLSPPTQITNNVDEEYATSENGACLSDSQYQCIRFSAFQQNNWHVLCDQNLTELPTPHYRVDADKGFNFSNADDAFVCQKKNHFQITCHVQLIGDAQFVKTSEGLQKINSFHLHFYGVKYDCPTQTIRVEQSQSDRSKKPFHPVLVELVSSQVTKVTVGRLHFSETTSNNMRKKGKPNPEQRYFQLVVGLHAHTSHGHFPVASHASQRIIVRASNPGQFESDVELCWQKGQTQDSIFHAGKVGINTDRPDESLVIHGNLKITGHIIQPSDLRAKKNIVECDTAEQLRNVQRLRVVRYEYAPGFASQLNLNPDLADTGVIAQEVAQIIPEAVSPTGDIILDNGRTINNFLVVNKERIFMENVGAVKELCKVTDNLETRIGQLERINRRLNKLKRDDSLKSTSTVSSTKHKCRKHSACQKEPELCSNKFIQIVIVILVLIMAFCLAAITTLYLMEAGRHNQLAQAYNFASQSGFNTKRPTKSAKVRPWQTTPNVHHPYKDKENEIPNNRAPIENLIASSKSPLVIGKPAFCQGLEEDIESSNLCQVYCCLPLNSAITSSEMDGAIYDKTKNLTKPSSTIINIDKNKILKPFHSNNIDKQRQKRDSDDWTDQENIYDNLDTSEQIFTVIVQGRGFNMTLTNDYCIDCSNNLFNITYVVPISKYMADDFITLTFKPNQANIKDLENCQNIFKQECPFWDEEKSGDLRKVNEHLNLQKVNSKATGITFEVNMTGFQTKMMTYRASLFQNQNVCRLASSKVGKDYIEYNLYFFRDCEG